MAYEIFNQGPVTPHRLHAVVRLVERMKEIQRQELVNLLQPQELKLENQETATLVINAAINCGLLVEDKFKKLIRISDGLPNLESIKDFRRWMQNRLLGVTDEDEPNFLLNLFTAWYMGQGEKVFKYSKDVDKKFNSEVFSNEIERSFNSTKLNNWKTWAAFLGFGWFNDENGVLFPDAHDRIEPHIAELLPKKELVFGEFMKNLNGICPELDGGSLFKKCMQYSSLMEGDGNTLKLALSTALRILEQEKRIKLINRADAKETWHLHPASAYTTDQVTHIQQGEQWL
jgi:hypothetical protein